MNTSQQPMQSGETPEKSSITPEKKVEQQEQQEAAAELQAEIEQHKEELPSQEARKEDVKLHAQLNPPTDDDQVQIQQTVQDVSDIAKTEEEKVQQIVQLGLQKGPGPALEAAKRSGEAYLVDRVHDELSTDENYARLKAAKFL